MVDRYLFLQETIEIVSELFNVVITTINSNYIRTSGTGGYRGEIGKIVENPNIFRKVIENKETIIVNSPSKDPVCAHCENINNCREKAAIYAPLTVKGEISGAIGIIAFTEEQKNSGLFQRHVFVNFANKLSELIASKIEATQYAEELRVNLNETLAILNSVHDGVIAADENGRITQVNQSAVKKFGITEKMVGRDINEVIPEEVLREIHKTKEYIDNEVTVANSLKESCNVLLTAKRIEDDNKEYGMIYIMKSLSDASNIASKLIHESDYKVEFSDIVGESRAIKDVIALSNKIADSDSTVLIRGESGTGKELFARAIHNKSGRRKGPFVAINCGAIPEALLESELFGYEDGAFTGAAKGGKVGKCQLANGGTLFLDEVGDIPIFLQVKFLRMLQERTIEKVGGNKSIPIDIRVIAATNRNLENMIENNEFRSDLYYRLNVIPVFIPPLRDRKEDILIISESFMDKYSKLLRRNVHDMTPQVKQILMDYSWPGNIRELENTIECALNVESQEILTSFSLPDRIKQGQPISIGNSIEEIRSASVEKGRECGETLKEQRRKTDINEVIKSLDKYGWDTKGKKQAAVSLGIGIATLYRILSDYQK